MNSEAHRFVRAATLAFAGAAVLGASAGLRAQCVPIPTLTASGVMAGANGAVNTTESWLRGGRELVVVGGGFTVVGGVGADGVAMFDPLTGAWQRLGSGVQAASGPGIVNCIAAIPNGNLIVGGSFVTAGGVTVPNLAQFDGVNWSALGPSPFPFSLVTALAADETGNGNFAVGGISTDGVRRIMLFNAAAGTFSFVGWVSAPVASSATIRGLMMRSGEIFVGGNFNSTFNGFGARVARFSPVLGGFVSNPVGTNWPFNTSAEVFDFALLSSTATATVALVAASTAGVIQTTIVDAGGLPTSQPWNLLGGPTNNPVGESVLITPLLGQPSRAFCGNAVFNGVSWSNLGNPTSTGSANVGHFAQANSVIVRDTDRFVTSPTSGWAPLQVGFAGQSPDAPSILDIAELPNGDVVVVGDFVQTPAGNGRLIARNNGTTWTSVTPPNGIAISAIAARPNGNLVGGVAVGPTGPTKVMEFNGTTWTDLVCPLTGVADIAIDSVGQVIVAGTTSQQRNEVWRRSGVTWTRDFGADQRIASIAMLPNNAYIAGGDFTLVNGIPAAHVCYVAAQSVPAAAIGAGVPTSVAWIRSAPNGKAFAATSQGIFEFANVTTAPTVQPAAMAAGQFFAVDVLPDGTLVAPGRVAGTGGLFRINGSAVSLMVSASTPPTQVLVSHRGHVHVAGDWFTSGIAPAGYARYTTSCLPTTTSVGQPLSCARANGEQLVATPQNLPWLGASFDTNVSGIGPIAYYMFEVFGFAPSNQLLAPVFPESRPGCLALLDPDPNLTMLLAPTPPSMNISNPVPLNPALSGLQVYQQFLQWEIGGVNIELLASNSLILTLGSF